MSTRKAPYKHADGSNCWTKDCRLGHVRNVSAEADPETFEQWIPKVKSKVETPDQIVERFRAEMLREENADLDFDSFDYEIKAIEEWKEEWTEAELQNLKSVTKILALTKNDPFTPAHEAKVRSLISKLEPYVERAGKRGRYGQRIYDGTDNSHRARDKMLHSMASNLLTRRLADDLEEPQLSEVSNDRLLNLREAQEVALKNLNHASYYKSEDKSYMGAVEPHFQNAIARVVSGEDLSPLDDGESNRDLFPPHHRIFSALHPTQGNASANQLYLAAVFPVNELKVEMDRVGIDNVSVSPFYNTREWGNVYTVMTPDGSTRSFSVYEHRNTDSIIINGTENWDGKELPYAADSKEAFFAEFEPDDRKRAAQALAFYMVQAQKGELEDPEALVDKVSRRDWAAILDNAIPGFKDWRQSHVSDTYIAPEQENEADILKRLDF